MRYLAGLSMPGPVSLLLKELISRLVVEKEHENETKKEKGKEKK